LTQRERAAGRIPANALYRLPTEAEWEYACRAQTSTRFSYGDDPGYTNLANYEWYYVNCDSQTQPVGRKLPNPWGLFDMQGNVWEWCQDRWADCLPGGTTVDPQGAATGSYRMMRGGSWGDWYLEARSCRSAFRDFRYSETRAIHRLGFRVVLGPGPP
jgi:formylglycine-generating enzyme required for sulfatase activity